jgi:hypothetical protein
MRCPTLLRTRVARLRAGWNVLRAHEPCRATAEEHVRRSPDLLAQFSRQGGHEGGRAEVMQVLGTLLGGAQAADAVHRNPGLLATHALKLRAAGEALVQVRHSSGDGRLGTSL